MCLLFQISGLSRHCHKLPLMRCRCKISILDQYRHFSCPITVIEEPSGKFDAQSLQIPEGILQINAVMGKGPLHTLALRPLTLCVDLITGPPVRVVPQCFSMRLQMAFQHLRIAPGQIAYRHDAQIPKLSCGSFAGHKEFANI